MYKTKIGAGSYQYATEFGTARVDRIENPSPGNGYPRFQWFLTLPGEQHAHDVYATMRDAVDALSLWCAEQRKARRAEQAEQERVVASGGRVVDTFALARLTKDDLLAINDMPVDDPGRCLLLASVWAAPAYSLLTPVAVVSARRVSDSGNDVTVYYRRSPDDLLSWVSMRESRFYRRRVV